MNNGYIKLHRKIKDNWIYEPNRARTRYEAWLDLLMDAGYREREISFNDKVITVKVGQVYSSNRYLAKRWKWSIGKVQRFLKAIQQWKMVEVQTDTGMSLISICNYETYQVPESQTDTETIHRRVRNGYKEEVNNKINNIYTISFEEFWNLYPRKIGKKNTFNKYKLALKKKDHADILNSLRQHIKSWRGTDIQYIPHPSTWLNQERYNDDVSSVQKEKQEFKKAKSGLFIAYCSKCGNRQFPNDKYQISDGSSCCRVDFVPEKPIIQKMDINDDNSKEILSKLAQGLN